MRAVAWIPAVGLTAGALAGSAWPGLGSATPLLVCVAGGWMAWGVGWIRLAALLAALGFLNAGLAAGAGAERAARHPPLRAVLEETYGGFRLEALSAAAPHGPVLTRLRLREDAAAGESGVRVRAVVESVRVSGRTRAAAGGVLLTVGGAAAPGRVAAWRAGRVVEAPLTFRRPARYLNDGVADGELAAARAGLSLLAGAKSGLLVEVAAHGAWWQEWAAGARSAVRQRIGRHMAQATPVERAIVLALLIGDRSAIPAPVTEALQVAGTYHLIAISGGNVALVVILLIGAARLGGAGPRLGAALALGGLGGYLLVVADSPSVERAGLMAALYLGARVLDLRSPAWNALAVSAGVFAVSDPLAVRAPAFWLTFGASGTLLALAGAGARRRPAPPDWRGRATRWVSDAVWASVAVEALILPVVLGAFQRITFAGIGANLVAVPAMGVAQVAGMGLVLGGPVPVLGDLGGAVAGGATRVLVDVSTWAAGLPWLALRLPAPPAWVWLPYAAALGWAWRSSHPRRATTAILLVVGVLAWGWARAWPPPSTGRVVLTAFDVGQGDAVLVEGPGRAALLVDAGPAGGAAKALETALWARGLRRLSHLVVTHGDPDHGGGAPAVIEDFRPRVVATGIPVRGHPTLEAIGASARAVRARQERWRAGESRQVGPMRLRILHPENPDWERPRVRNDDSVVVEVVTGSVAILLTGDAGQPVEARIAETLTAAPLRILKVGHHGSRTSSGPDLVDRWRPQIAIVSCGRGNGFGHPSPEVLARLARVGARVFRTDRDGQITLDTDGQEVHVRTATGRRLTLRAAPGETRGPGPPS